MILRLFDFLMEHKDYIFDILTALLSIISWFIYRSKNPATKELFDMGVAVYNWIEKSHKGRKKKADEFQKEFVTRFQKRYGKRISAKTLNKVIDFIESEIIYPENFEIKMNKEK